jgi:MoxR-like ATPase
VIPEGIRRQHVEAAIREIDINGTPMERESTKFDLVIDGKHYPPKYALSLAAKIATGTELDPAQFSGGSETNEFLESLGFEVSSRTESSLAEFLETILRDYPAARASGKFGKENDVWSTFANFGNRLSEIKSVRSLPTLKIKWSVGQGNWAKVPWVALLDTRESDTTQQGVYCVFLFRQDCTGVYLTLNQGVTQPRDELGAEKAREFLRSRADDLRAKYPDLSERSFLVDGSIDLRADPGLGSEYEASTIAHKLYQKNRVPNDEEIEKDLNLMLSAYSKYINENGGARSWIFQASPQYYDIVAAIKALKTQTWLVAQHKDKIHSGDRAYMWESGTDAGIVGVATIVGEPSELPYQPDEKPFMREESKFAGPQTRAVLRVDKVLPMRLSRKELSQDPVLKSLSVIQFPRGTNFEVTAEQAGRLESLLRLSGPEKNPMAPELERTSIVDTSRFSNICKKTFLSPEFFGDLEKILSSKKQLILQGAPGTGKTFVAEEFAHWWAGNPKLVRTVQLHESYGYEDFVEGIKPKADPSTNETKFILSPGPFMAMCDLANRNPSERVVLVIDEINRAKTARVFGELLYLLEYRQKRAILQSGNEFAIPSNLFIIGTMNTVDKSIALVDFALRRRFAFVTLLPVEDGKSVVLRKWLEEKNISNADEIERLFVSLNKVVAAKGEDLVIGHSYFMTDEVVAQKKATNKFLEFTWRYYILPLVAEYEYEFNRQQIEEKYGLETIRSLSS